MTLDVAFPAWVQDPVALRVVAALADGRSLPISMLAAETGLSADTVAATLSRLHATGAVTTTRRGRWTYHRVAEPVDPVLLADAPPPASRRPGTALHTVRTARSCYRHPAGRLGVTVTDALRRLGYVTGPDGDLGSAARMSGPVPDEATYAVTSEGLDFLARMGFPRLDDLRARPCVDWTEQRHHLAGELGRALLTGMTAHGWVVTSPTRRALVVTELGAVALREHLGVPW